MTLAPFLDVTPLEGLLDEELSISIIHLEPKQEIVLRAETHSADQKKWISSAHYRADHLGRVFLLTDPPISGSYQGVDRMGLIWSMEPEDQSKNSFKTAESGMDIRFILEIDGKKVTEKEVKRLPIHPTVKSFPIQEEITGILYVPPSHYPLPAVITLSGGGGMHEARAQLLASHGFVTLALAYFGAPGVPQQLENIPLEYFEKAIDWIQKRPEVGNSKVGLWGISRGGEAALLAGALYPHKIGAIVTHVASSVIYRAPGSKESPWTFAGRPILPLAPMISEERLGLQGTDAETAISLSPFFLEAKDQFPDLFTASRIPVEKIEAPLLVIGAREDQMWPSAFFAEQIEEWLGPAQKIIIYEGAGHKMALPFTPTAGAITYHPEIQRWFDFGGSAEENAFTSQDAWEETLLFFSQTLLSK